MRSQSKRNAQNYRLVVILAGFTLFVFLTTKIALDSGLLWLGALVVFFVGIPSILAVLLNYFQSAQKNQERLEQELGTLNQVSDAIQTTLDMDKLLPALQHEISQHFGVDSFYVAIYDDQDEIIWYPLAVKRGVRQTWTAREKADRLTDRVIFERLPILIPGKASQELVRIGLPAGEDPPAAWMGVPLRSSDQVIGCLAVFTYSTEFTFSAADLDLFVTLSGQVGVAIANALLHEKLQHRAEQLEALNQFAIEITRSLDAGHVFSYVCQAISRVVNSHRSAVYVLDLEQGLITLAHANGLSEDFIRHNQSYAFSQDLRAQCLHTGQPALFEDITRAGFEPEYEQLLFREGIGALGSFPLVTPDGQIGYLSVYYDESHDFSSEEVELVQSFTAQAALAVSNARLHERTDLALSRRVHQLSVLETISRELAAATYSDQLFDMILDYSMEFTSSNWGVFGVFDPTSRLLNIKAQRGYREAFGQLSLGEGIPGKAIQQQKMIYVPDVRQEESYLDFTQHEARSHLSVPLVYQSCVLGVLSLESEHNDAFTDRDVAFVSQLANQAAIALQNARLFSDISSVRDRLSAILNSVREGILLFNQDGEVVLANKAVEIVTEQSLEDIQGNRLGELPEPVLSRLGFTNRTQAIQQLHESSAEKVVFDSISGEKVLERSIIAVQGESERPIGWMLVLRDVTDEMRVAQARELITETLIHDLRSPVSAVLGALEVMESTLPADEPGELEMSYQALHVARRGAQRVLGLVENLLDISRMQAGKMELTRNQAEIQKVVAGVINEFLPQSQEYGIILHNKIPSDWPKIYIDQAKITRVIANLIDNALKYSPSGTQVMISGEHIPQNAATIRVSDCGPGIPAEYRDKIFERFSQIPGSRGRRRGTGLGLTFCKLTVEAHGGRIWVESNSSGGSDFVFTLPLVSIENQVQRTS